MFSKILNKCNTIINSAIGKIHLFFEKTGLVKKIEFEVYKREENSVSVNFDYPVNFDKNDEPLFAHYNLYQTGKEEIFKLKNVSVSKEGVVFSGMNNFGPALPHPLFRATYGWLYILNKYINGKTLTGSSVKTYVLIHDFWSAANYYHWLVDTLPRLCIIGNELKQKDHVLILPANPPKFIISTLAYFEIDSFIYLENNEYIAVDNLLMPNYLAGSGRIHPEKVFDLKKFFLGKINSQVSKERLYVSRARQKSRKIANEREVVNVMRQFGFETVYFEDYTFEQQIELVQNCKFLVSSHGANLTNTLFMPQGSKVIELIRFDKPNFCYWALANVAKLDYYYQLCQLQKGDNLVVDTEKLRNNLITILK